MGRRDAKIMREGGFNAIERFQDDRKLCEDCKKEIVSRADSDVNVYAICRCDGDLTEII